MDLQPLYSLLVLGFSLGLLHAMDADHIMAVSVLASNKNNKGKSAQSLNMIRFCSAWAFGHGGVLLILAVLFIFLGIELPSAVSHWAEKLIGLILISVGLWILWNVYTQKIRLHVHTHDEITHVHLSHKHQQHHNHQPVLVGITHGLAGSAPVLALIPAMESGSTWLGLFYVALFSLGVLIMMMVFGFCFGRLRHFLESFGQQVYQFSRVLIAAVSVGFGSYWLLA